MKETRVSGNKLIILFSAITLVACFALLQIKAAFALVASGSADPAVKKYNITFPISTLGNCTDLESCKTYCEDSTNKEACLNFAKSKGFDKPSPGQGNARARLVIEKAKTELGCATEQECKEFCAKEENAVKCADFAKRYNLIREPKKLINNLILEKAKAALGCTDEEKCRDICRSELNREKCSQFARSVGLPGGMVKIASMSGKNSEELDQVKQTIEKCMKEPKYCQQHFGAVEKQLMDTSDSFCKNNPEKCKEFLKGLQEASRTGKPVPDFDKAFENAGVASRSANPGLPEKIQFKDKIEIKNPQVRGISKAPSFFDWFFNVFLK